MNKYNCNEATFNNQENYEFRCIDFLKNIKSITKTKIIEIQLLTINKITI